ncbi:MAG: hypothetical protein NTU48_10170 [Legionellales bacterium]|nr:hypothetical protein [Legionellales bacterium]
MPSFNLKLENDTDQNFMAFIMANDETERLRLSKQLKKTYTGVVEKKKYTDIGGNTLIQTYRLEVPFTNRSPLEIVANMGLLPQVESLFVETFIKIEALDVYGQSLLDAGCEQKGSNTKELARQLKDAIIKFKLSIAQDEIEPTDKFAVKFIDNHKETAKNIRILLQQGHKTMGNDRNLSDWIVHFCLALTGIGLFIMLANKICYGQFFLNSTKRQVKLDDIKQEMARTGLSFQ